MNWTVIETFGAFSTESHMGTAGEAATLVMGKYFTARHAGILLGWA